MSLGLGIFLSICVICGTFLTMYFIMARKAQKMFDRLK